jgi:hypothetical protein
MNPFPERDELRDLLDALCEETITAEQLQRLEQLLLARPEAEGFYIQYMSQQADLAGCFGEPPSATERSLRDRVGAAARAARGRAAKPARRSRRRAWLLVGGGLGLSGLAAAVLVVVLWPAAPPTPAAPVQPPEASDDTVAVLLQAPEAVWDDADPAPRVGEPLPPGWLRLKSGFAHLEFYSGAMVVLEGPAEFQIVSRMEAFCTRGKLRATVPEQAHGFTIRSPALDLVDRGTEFGLRVGTGDPTEVHVFQGKVDLFEPGPDHPAAAKQQLTTGHGLRLDGAGSQAIAADPTTFKSAEDLERRLLEDVRRRQKEWAAASEALRHDPSLVAYYPFQDEDVWGHTLRDQAGGRQNPRDGVVVGCAWGAGRWPGKQGLEFRQVSDRVRLDVPGEFDALTLAAWIRVDSLPNRFNSLMMADGSPLDSPHWHISSTGRIELGVLGRDQKAWTHYLTPPAVTADRLGQWALLAVVYDRAAGRVTHYVNGDAVEQDPIKTDAPLRIGAAEIGNWNVGTSRNPNPVRFFRGCMDEFVIFSRVVGDDEMRRLYEQGRPPW